MQSSRYRFQIIIIILIDCLLDQWINGHFWDFKTNCCIKEVEPIFISICGHLSVSVKCQTRFLRICFYVLFLVMLKAIFCIVIVVANNKTYII